MDNENLLRGLALGVVGFGLGVGTYAGMQLIVDDVLVSAATAAVVGAALGYLAGPLFDR